MSRAEAVDSDRNLDAHAFLLSGQRNCLEGNYCCYISSGDACHKTHQTVESNTGRLDPPTTIPQLWIAASWFLVAVPTTTHQIPESSTGGPAKRVPALKLSQNRWVLVVIPGFIQYTFSNQFAFLLSHPIVTAGVTTSAIAAVWLVCARQMADDG